MSNSKCKKCGGEVLDQEQQLCGPCLIRKDAPADTTGTTPAAFPIDDWKMVMLATAVLSMLAAAKVNCGETHFLLKTLYEKHMEAHGIAGDSGVIDPNRPDQWKNMTDDQITAMFGGHKHDPSKKPN